MGKLTDALIGKTAAEKRAILEQSIKRKRAGKADANKAIEAGLQQAYIEQAKGGGTYTIKQEDLAGGLFGLSQKLLGSQLYVEDLSAANNDLKTARAGMTINVPRVLSGTGYRPTISYSGFEELTGEQPVVGPSSAADLPAPAPQEQANQVASTLGVPTSSLPQFSGSVASLTGANNIPQNVGLSPLVSSRSASVLPNASSQSTAQLTGANNIKTSSEALSFTPQETETARLTGQALSLGSAPYDPKTGKYRPHSETTLNVFGVSPANQELYQETVTAINSGAVPESMTDQTRLLLGQTEQMMAEKGYEWTGAQWVKGTGGKSLTGNFDYGEGIYGLNTISEAQYRKATGGNRRASVSQSSPRPQYFDAQQAISRATNWRISIG